MKKRLTSVLLVVLLAYFSICLACSISPGLFIDVVQNSFDVRLSGLADNGWSTPDMSFTEPRISSFGAKVKITYSNGEMDYLFNSRTAKATPFEKGIILESESLLSSVDGIEIKAVAKSPKTSRVSGKYIGAKFESIQIIPKYLLIFPALNIVLTPLVLISLLLLAVSYAYDSRRFDIIPAIVTASAVGFFLGQNKIDAWPKGLWIWCFTFLFFIGMGAYRALGPGNNYQSRALKNSFPIILALILLAGIYVRFQGLDFGLPGLFHPDESRKSKIIRTMVVTGDLNPHYFRHPNFLLYAGAFSNWVYSLFVGKVPDPMQVVYLGRCVSAILGSASILVIFLIGRMLFSKAAGIIAAAFLAFSPLHVVSSRYIKEDASMLFFALVCFYFAAKSLKNNCNIKYSLLSGLFAGFSASSKYSGLLNLIFSLLPIYERALVILQSLIPSKRDKFALVRFTNNKFDPGMFSTIILSLAIILTFIAGFLIFTPYSIFDSKTFIEDFMGEKQHMERGHTVAITPTAYYWGFHIQRSLLVWYQSIFVSLAFIALGYVFLKRRMYGFLILCSVLLYYLPAEYVKAKPEPQPERYVLPCIPFLALALGDFLTGLRNNSKILKVGLAILTSLALFQTASYSYIHSQSIKRDTRLQAKEWILQNIPKGSKIIIDWHFYGPPGLDRHYKVLQLKDKAGAKLNRGLSVEALKETGYDYFVFSSFSYGRFLMADYRSHNLSKRFKTFFNEMPPVIVFNNPDYAYGFHNPEIKIFKLK